MPNQGSIPFNQIRKIIEINEETYNLIERVIIQDGTVVVGEKRKQDSDWINRWELIVILLNKSDFMYLGFLNSVFANIGEYIPL